MRYDPESYALHRFNPRPTTKSFVQLDVQTYDIPHRAKQKPPHSTGGCVACVPGAARYWRSATLSSSNSPRRDDPATTRRAIGSLCRKWLVRIFFPDRLQPSYCSVPSPI
ncbi:hypothetical protein CKAH01_03215 [Colletotrichum kahawae]|uniref:Uncharacterized protein n=1 Tax=Colletotrichum kahawae TaxID=34407 RepID=A0AAE0DBX5_COLKA|nr:hypothetical protein CKAH01_03215 [Colletotrichum kahawae]